MKKFKYKKALIVVLILIIIAVGSVIGFKVFMIKNQSSEEYITYQEISKVNDGLSEYDGHCTLAQTQELIDLLINKINKYANDDLRRINEIDVTYTIDSATDSVTNIVYNGSIDAYVNELNTVKSKLDSVNSVVVGYEYDENGYVEKVNLQLHTTATLRNMVHEHNPDDDLPPMTQQDILNQIEYNKKLDRGEIN